MGATLATSVIACGLKGLDLKRLRVPLEPGSRHRTPALGVGALLTGAACPAPIHVLELAILEGTMA